MRQTAAEARSPQFELIHQNIKQRRVGTCDTVDSRPFTLILRPSAMRVLPCETEFAPALFCTAAGELARRARPRCGGILSRPFLLREEANRKISAAPSA